MVKKEKKVVKPVVEKHTFFLVDNRGETTATYRGRFPRDCALKAARRGIENIRLRKARESKIHVYKGGKVDIPMPKEAPQWMKDSGKKTISKPWVSRIGIQKE